MPSFSAGSLTAPRSATTLPRRAIPGVKTSAMSRNASSDATSRGNAGTEAIGTAYAAACSLAAMPKQEKVRANIRILPVKGVSQTINYLLEDRDELDWLVAVGKNKNGEIFFYDTGGDILEDLGTLEYLKQRIIRAHFGDDPD